MDVPISQALDDLISKMRSGRLTRRTFLEQALVLGLTSSSASSLLAACGGSSNSSAGNGPALNIVWENHNSDTYKVYQNIADDFSQTNKHGIHVTYIDGPNDATELHSIFLNMLTARTSAIDVMSMDTTWAAEFALNQWVVPIDQKWPASERTSYLPIPIQGCTFEGQIWAAPFNTDVGLLYYRKDLLPTPPSSWEELTEMAMHLQANGSVKSGYVWQGASYEGLVDDFIEVLHGYGGDIFDPQNPKLVIVNSPQAVSALTTMANWVGTISPDIVLQGKEENIRNYWQQGQTAFMRNWPYAYSLGNAPTSKVAGKFNISSIPYGGTNRVGHSALGGWNLGINAFSNPKKIDAAWQFVQYVLSESAQRMLVLEASLLPTLKSVYQDQDVLTKNPFFKQLGPILRAALPRPTSPRYTDITLAIQSRVSSALSKKSSPSDALAGLKSDLDLIVNS